MPRQAKPKPVELDPSEDSMPESFEHPKDVTDEESKAGKVMYHEVDDLDDDSNGLD